jgi:Tol biopolymer transport system component
MRPSPVATASILLSIALAACDASQAPTAAPASPTPARGSSTALASVAPPSSSPKPTAAPTAAPTTSPVPLTGTIVFSLEHGIEGAQGAQLMVGHLDGSDPTAITDLGLGFATEPSWAADHTTILFALASGGGHSHIWSVPAAGGTPTELTHGNGEDHDPTESPDGQWIVFDRFRDHEPSSIWIMRTDGTDLRQLTIGRGDEGDWRPAISPDGHHVAFVRDGGIVVGRVDPGLALRLLRNVVPGGTGAERPEWSPDATQLVYLDTDGADAGTHLVDLDTLRDTRIGELGDPSFSPMGDRILGSILRMDLPAVALSTMAIDGSDVHDFWHPQAKQDLWPNYPTWIAEG